ncbi:MAG: SurA N-terminal domain-containing protein [Paracoccaceae bacterium]|nr:SurA N-terminal domain-containing protein [Paracoccaceae bacterium]
MAKGIGKGKASQTFVWIILGLLIVGLAGFGATSFTGGGSAVARVGEAEVTIDDYARALQTELRQIQAQAGRAVPLSEARTFGVDQIVLGRLVGSAALDDQAQAAGVSVGDERIAEEVRSTPAFLGIDGAFDPESYRFALQQNGLSVRDYEASLRADLSRQILQAGIVGGVAAPEPYVDTLLGFLREERDVTWAPLSEADLAEPVPDPTMSELAAFHTENAGAFTVPETKVLTVAALTPDMLIDGIEIDETMLREVYDERLSEYETPERRLVERLVFADTAAAEAARAGIEAGETTFEALVEERGLTLIDVDLGDVSARDLGEAAEAVFALDGPGVAGPAPSSLGPALFRVNAILPATSVTFDEARGELFEEIAAERARRAILDEIQPVDDLLAGGATLEELVAETQMALQTLDWRPGEAEGPGGYEAIRQAAAAAREGDFPEVIELEDGGIAAIRLDETRPPALRPLDEIEDEVAAAWRAQELGFRLAARGAEIAGEIEAGRDMAAFDLALRWDRGLTRNGFVEGAPAGFLPTLFEMAPGEVRVIEGPGAAVIARLEEVRAPSGEDADTLAIRALLAGQVQQGLAEDLLLGFMNAARDSVRVDIDQAAINAVHSSFP